jgi:hypothetical protein
MSEMKDEFTPGPWTCSSDRQGIWEIIHDGDRLAQVWRLTFADDFPAQANAHLMAAAPDLYAAARRALAVLKRQGENIIPRSVIEALDAAISKAEGK